MVVRVGNFFSTKFKETVAVSASVVLNIELPTRAFSFRKKNSSLKKKQKTHEMYAIEKYAHKVVPNTPLRRQLNNELQPSGIKFLKRLV